MAEYAHKVKSGGDKVVSGQPIKRLTAPPPTTNTPFSETADKVWTNIQAYITDTKVRIINQQLVLETMLKNGKAVLEKGCRMITMLQHGFKQCPE